MDYQSFQNWLHPICAYKPRVLAHPKYTSRSPVGIFFQTVPCFLKILAVNYRSGSIHFRWCNHEISDDISTTTQSKSITNVVQHCAVLVEMLTKRLRRVYLFICLLYCVLLCLQGSIQPFPKEGVATAEASCAKEQKKTEEYHSISSPTAKPGFWSGPF